MMCALTIVAITALAPAESESKNPRRIGITVAYEMQRAGFPKTNVQYVRFFDNVVIRTYVSGWRIPLEVVPKPSGGRREPIT